MKLWELLLHITVLAQAQWPLLLTGAAPQSRRTGTRFIEYLNKSIKRYELVKHRPYPCPDGFINRKMSCYHIASSSSAAAAQTPSAKKSKKPGWTWHEAKSYCSERNSKLVSIEGDNEQYYLERMIRASGEIFWTSGTNRFGPWHWHGTKKPLDYINWVSDWTSLAYEVPPGNCAVLDATEMSQWMFWPCTNQLYPAGYKHSKEVGIGVICEKHSRKGKKRRRKYRKKARKTKQLLQQRNTLGYLLDV